MKAVLMAGGIGKRLRPLTRSVPKPMVPVLNKPLLAHTISLLQQHHFTDIIILLYYQPDVIRNYLGDGRQFGVDIQYIVADEDFGTAGAVKLAESYLDEPFLVVSADLMTNFNLTRFCAFAASRKEIATLALAQVAEPQEFGNVTTGVNRRIERFVEKPRSRQAQTGLVNAGIYVLDPEIFEWIDTGLERLFARDIFPHLLDQNIPLLGYQEACYWRDLGNPRAYLEANLEALRCHPTNRLIAEACEIADNVILENVIIGKGCHIEEASRLEDAVLWPGVHVGRGCHISYGVIATGVEIGEGATLERNVTIGEKAIVDRRCVVSAGSIIDSV